MGARNSACRTIFARDDARQDNCNQFFSYFFLAKFVVPSPTWAKGTSVIDVCTYVRLCSIVGEPFILLIA